MKKQFGSKLYLPNDGATGGGADGAGAGGGGGAGDAGGAGNDAGKSKRDPIYADLPDDHPLVKRHEALKAENKELKPKAKLVDDAENAKKSDATKIAELTTQIESLNGSVPGQVAAGLREHLVELHEIDSDDAELFLTGDTPELLLKQVKRLLEQSGSGSKRQNQVLREGTKSARQKPSTMTEFLGNITGKDG
jgi:hypothetical protein